MAHDSQTLLKLIELFRRIHELKIKWDSKECAEEARRFLHGELCKTTLPQQEKQNTPVCPHCGGTLLGQRRIWPAIVLMLLCFGSPAQVTPVRRCSSCGKK